MQQQIISPYLDSAIDHKKRNALCRDICNHISNLNLDFDSIAFSGMSGALIAPIVAWELGKNLILVRKERSKHSPVLVEGNYFSKKYIILDDFCNTGETIRYIIGAIKSFEFSSFDLTDSECVGAVMYGGQNPKYVNEFSFKIFPFNLVIYG